MSGRLLELIHRAERSGFSEGRRTETSVGAGEVFGPQLPRRALPSTISTVDAVEAANKGQP